MSRKRQQKHADDIYELKGSQVLCIVRGIASANMVECWDGISDGTIVAELPPRFRKTLWIRRGLAKQHLQKFPLILGQY